MRPRSGLSHPFRRGFREVFGGFRAGFRDSTLINDPQLSKTAGRWAWATVPGDTSKAHSRTWIDGHSLSVPKYAKYPDWSLEFIRMACSKQWMLRSMERGNAPPRGSVLRDPTMVAKLRWPPVATEA
ncbi:MAG TPA: hypothetical protein VNW54_06920, partial [Granulicella sp.]|nr:hypothetical protein [Granulicella sp.]